MMGIRQRVALAHVAAIVVVLSLTAFGAYWTLARSVRGQLDAALLALAETEQGLLPENRSQPVVIHDVNQGMAPSFIRLDRLVQIIDADGQPLARSSNLHEGRLPAPSSLMTSLDSGNPVFDTLEGYGEEPVRLVTLPITGHPPVRAIQVAGSLDDVNNVIHSAGLLFVMMGVALFIGLSVAGAAITRSAFRTIDHIVSQAQRIGDGDLGQRLDRVNSRDEIGRLVDTLNTMFERLEQGLEIQRRFTSDASHELRSPLSRLRAEIEITLRRSRSSEEYREVLASCLDEVARLTALLEELLALARVDAESDRSAREISSLNEVVNAAVLRLEPHAEERGVGFEIVSSDTLEIDMAVSAASLVIANLLDNALKFSPNQSIVTITLGARADFAQVEVTDQGPGIDAAEVPRLFERFYRGDASRKMSAKGFGLGLALCKAILHAHGGAIEVRNAVGAGAQFVARIPLVLRRDTS